MLYDMLINFERLPVGQCFKKENYKEQKDILMKVDNKQYNVVSLETGKVYYFKEKQLIVPIIVDIIGEF